MWIPAIEELAKTNTVIAPDLRGFGRSAKTPTGLRQEDHGVGYPRTCQINSATRRCASSATVFGLMVAYAYAAQYSAEVDRIVLMDAFLPGVGDWTKVWLLRDLWHFHFYGETPLKLVKGREQIYFEHFWNDFAADRTKVRVRERPPFLCQILCPAGRHARGIRGFRAFEQDSKDFAGLFENQADHADAGAFWRRSRWAVPDRSGPDGG